VLQQAEFFNSAFFAVEATSEKSLDMVGPD